LKITGGSTSTTMDFRPVPESRMRNALNLVTPSRVLNDAFRFGDYLSFVGSVVSPAFECDVPTSVQEPFALNLTVTSLIDTSRSISGDFTNLEDTCLARLEEIGQFRDWRCLFGSQYDRRAICQASQAGCIPGLFAVRNVTTDPPPANSVHSVINRCTQVGAALLTTRTGTVYAFITAPLATYVPPEVQQNDPVKENILAIILGIIFGILILAFLIYIAVRLFRYRKKYHDEKDEANRLKEEVENMTQFGGEAGNRDDQVVLTKNPLAQQLAHLQQAVKEEDVKLQEAEQNLKLQEADIRKDHIDNMRNNRDKMMAELERLKSQLNEAQATRSQATTDDHDQQPASGGAWDSNDNAGAGGQAGQFGQHDDGAYRAGFDQYQAPRGGPKKKDF